MNPARPCQVPPSITPSGQCRHEALPQDLYQTSLAAPCPAPRVLPDDRGLSSMTISPAPSIAHPRALPRDLQSAPGATLWTAHTASRQLRPHQKVQGIGWGRCRLLGQWDRCRLMRTLYAGLPCHGILQRSSPPGTLPSILHDPLICISIPGGPRRKRKGSPERS